jgi:hypothetical protein
METSIHQTVLMENHGFGMQQDVPERRASEQKTIIAPQNPKTP